MSLFPINETEPEPKHVTFEDVRRRLADLRADVMQTEAERIDVARPNGKTEIVVVLDGSVWHVDSVNDDPLGEFAVSEKNLQRLVECVREHLYGSAR
jgi:hypothetical protein